MTRSVYNLFGKNPKLAEETVILTEREALVKQIEGYRVVNLTEAHGITPENYEKGREILKTVDMDEYDKKVRATYKPKWHDSHRKASRALDRI